MKKTEARGNGAGVTPVALPPIIYLKHVQVSITADLSIEKTMDNG